MKTDNDYLKFGDILGMLPWIQSGLNIYEANRFPTENQQVVYLCDDLSCMLFATDISTGTYVGDKNGKPYPNYPITNDAFTKTNIIYEQIKGTTPISVTSNYALWGVQDEIVSHFINRKIGFDNVYLFVEKFRSIWLENLYIYQSLYNVWYDFYEGKTITNIDEPAYNIFMDYYHKHTNEFTGNDERTNTITGSRNGANTGTVKVSIDSDTTTNNTNEITGNSDTTNTGTINVENDGTNNNTNTNNTISTNGGNTRTLVSDTPQSIVNESTTGNPTDIKWTYATNLTDNIQNTSITNTGTITDENTSHNTGKTTNDLSQAVDTHTTGTDNGTINVVSTNTTTNDLQNTETSNGTNNETTNRNNKDTDNTIDFREAQNKIDAFLNSPFSRFYYNMIFSDFEPLFLPYYYNDVYPLYTWKNCMVMNMYGESTTTDNTITVTFMISDENGNIRVPYYDAENGIYKIIVTNIDDFRTKRRW